MRNIYKSFMFLAFVSSFSVTGAETSGHEEKLEFEANFDSDSGNSSNSPDSSYGAISPEGDTDREVVVSASECSDCESGSEKIYKFTDPALKLCESSGNDSGAESVSSETENTSLRDNSGDSRRNRLRRIKACRNLPQQTVQRTQRITLDPVPQMLAEPLQDPVPTPRVGRSRPDRVVNNYGAPSKEKKTKPFKHFRRNKTRVELSADSRNFLLENPDFLQTVVNKFFAHPSICIEMDEDTRRAYFKEKLTEMSIAPDLAAFLRESVNMQEIWEYFRHITKIALSKNLESFRKEELLFLENGSDPEKNPYLMKGYIQFVAEHLVNIINTTPTEVKQFFYDLGRKSETLEYPQKSAEYDCFMFSLSNYFLYVLCPLFERSLRVNYWVYEHELLIELNEYQEILKNRYNENIKKEKIKKYTEIFDNMSSMSNNLATMRARAKISEDLYSRQVRLVFLLQKSFNAPSGIIEKSDTDEKKNLAALRQMVSMIFYNPVESSR